jgi:anti-sigma factor RsiW
MSEIFQCGDNAALVGYLYDECDATERVAITAHVALCAACAAELAALESTRIQLGSWAPPEAQLGFTIVRSAAEPKAEPVRLFPAVPKATALPSWKTGWFARPLPAWAQVAAAAVIFATGLSLGIARGTARETTQEATAAATPAPTDNVSPGQLAALERRLRDEIAQIRTASTRVEASQPALAEAHPSTANRDALKEVEEPLMARVRALIDESEQRQQRELALRTTQIVRDFDSQRRVDLTQIQRNFGQIEGLTGAEVREQRQMLNYLMRVSEQPR